ncbi:STM3941 family protein [Anaerosporobacter sp.]|uniref:STM3941 family protein n=1 Tax=Anaerosporobacter sp. TaxID=1872529 RepID=UPI0028A0690C|nr:STM3941 family protein [Anaerosporobacter sp.]
MKDLVIYEKKKQAYKLLGQAFLMTGASGVLLYMGIVEENFLFDVMGGLGSFFFLICTVVQFIRVIKKKPLFIIKENGVDDTSTATSVGFITYDAIKEIVIGKILGKECIGLYLTDIDTFLESLPPVKQKAIRSNLANKFPPILLRVDSIEEKTGREIYEELQQVYESCVGNKQ